MSDDDETSRRCWKCGGKLARRSGQSHQDGRLRWWESSDCASCGQRSEAAGGEAAPEELRREWLAAGGRWALEVGARGADVVLLLRALRERLGLSLAEASRLRARLPGEVLSGTRAEMECLAFLCAEGGVRAEVVPATATTDAPDFAASNRRE